MRRTKKDADQTRAAVLSAALAVFGRKGYTAATLDDVARDAKVTRGAVYWHFKGKRELYLTLVGEGFARYGHLFADLFAEGAEPLETIRGFVVRGLVLVEDDAFYRSLLELTLFKTEVTQELADGMDDKQKANKAMMAAFTDLIARGQDSGTIRNDIDAASLAVIALAYPNSLVSLWLTVPGAFSLRELAPAAADVVVEGMRKRG